jgi:nitrous oxidase accessory protein NosD
MKATQKRHQKGLLVVASTLILLLSVSVLSLNVLSADASQTIVVPENFPTINEAIAHASAGDTIIVNAGEYHENPTVDKPLSLISQGATVIGEGGLDRGHALSSR